MDEWGTAIWDTPNDSQPSLGTLGPSFPDVSEPEVGTSASLDDFDDFGEAAQPAMNDDDFGNDFGDFGDAQDGGQGMNFDDEGDMGGFRMADRIPKEFTPPLPATWEPLRLDPLPPPTELVEEVQEILSPLWAHIDTEAIMTSEDIRQVEGLGQVLVTPDSRALYQTLFNASPPAATRPPNWTRSRIRRQHLIALGIPINLDEVMPRANGKPLPTLNITTRPSSAPPGPRPKPASNPPSGSNTRAGTPTSQLAGRTSMSPALGLGPKPRLDDGKISAMLELSADTLPLLPLPTLERHLQTLRGLTSDTSALLSYLLQTREALQQDSETYNGLIAELVGEAQKMKTGPKSRTGVGRRGSGMV